MPDAKRSFFTPRYDLGVRRLFGSWRHAISRTTWRLDAGAGLEATALSLALAIVIAQRAGLPATSALVSVVVASGVVALMGGSTLGLSGPGLAMGLVLARLAQQHGMRGVALAVALTGALQLASGALGLGRFARLAPLNVVHGFTLGMGGLLILLSVPYVLGVTATSDTSATYMIDQVSARLGSVRPAAVVLAASTCTAALLAMRFARRAPVTLIALTAAALVVHFGHLNVATLPDLPVRVPHATPLALPTARYADFALTAFALFALASLETFLSASADEQHEPGERNDPDQDLIGHGLANIVLAFFGGLPATSSIIRTRALRNADARTRLAPLVHALSAAALVPLVLAADRWMSLAALSGVIVAHALRLLDPRPIAALWRVSRLHAGVSVITAATMAFAGVLTGVETGLFFALVLAMAGVARFRATLHRGGEGAPHQVTFSGPATFLAVPAIEHLRMRLAALNLTSGVIIDVRDVLVMDPTGCTQLVALVYDVADKGGNPAILGLAPSCRAMVLAADGRGLVAPRLAVTDRDVDAILGHERAYEMRALVVASLERFRSETRGHYESLFEQLADGQHPHTLFVTCVDSRVSPAMLTGAHPGEVFVVRCLGAMVPPPSEQASPGEGAAIEYAVGVLGVRNIVVCGHSSCGAVKAAKSGHVPDELASLQRWLEKAPLAAGDLAKHADLDDAARAVTVRQLENLRQFPLVRDRLAKGEIRLHAWFYNLAEAELFEWSEPHGRFEILAGPRTSTPPDESGSEPR